MTSLTLSATPGFEDPSFRNITWDERVESYKEQACGRTDGGRDLPMIETTFVTQNSEAAIFAVEAHLLKTGKERLPVVLLLPCRQQRPHTIGSDDRSVIQQGKQVTVGRLESGSGPCVSEFRLVERYGRL